MNLKERDYIEHLHICSTHDFLLFFTNRGKVYRLKVYELPEGSRTSKARRSSMLPLRDGERVMAVIPTRTSRRAGTSCSRPRTGLSRRRSSPPTTRRFAPTGSSRSRSARETSWSRCDSRRARTTCCWSPSRATRHGSATTRWLTGRDTSGVKGMNVSGKGNRVRARRGAPDCELLVVTGERVRQAHQGLRVPGQGARDQGRVDDR